MKEILIKRLDNSSAIAQYKEYPKTFSEKKGIKTSIKWIMFHSLYIYIISFCENTWTNSKFETISSNYYNI